MSITLQTLDTENLKSLQSLAKSVYLDGQCYEFAFALHRDLGWPMFGLITGSILGPVIRHVVVQDKEQAFWDVRGPVSLTDLGMPFGIREPLLKLVTEDDVRKVRPVDEFLIDRASCMAQALWPELDWMTSSFQGRVFAFMEELETLCRKHRLWIRAPYPAAKIVLADSPGDEKGFMISPTLDGQYFFDRDL